MLQVWYIVACLLLKGLQIKKELLESLSKRELLEQQRAMEPFNKELLESLANREFGGSKGL